MNRALLSLAFACVARAAMAQTSLPVGVDLFGDDLVQPLRVEEHGQFASLSYEGDKKRKVLDEYRQALIFHDGRQLCGRLSSLTAEEVTWERADADKKMVFPRPSVRRLLLGDPSLFPNVGVTAEVEPAVNKPALATVKLPGSDWLFGDLRAETGADYTLNLANGAALRLPRAQVEWISFAHAADPAFGFSGQVLSMEGWIVQNAGGPEMVDGVVRFKGPGWIGRNLNSVGRLEVDFEVPDEAGTIRLWLQPYGPSTNSYSTGTVELSFSKRQLGRLIFVNQFERQTTSMPQDGAKGPIRYRVFYDTHGNRLIVMRNDAVVGEWKLREQADVPEGIPGNRMPGLRGLCFDTQDSKGMSFKRLRVQPWDGVLPQERKGGAFFTVFPNGEKKSGDLDWVNATELQFAGTKFERKPGTFIRFPQELPGSQKADALLVLGENGELAAADVQVRDDQVSGATNIDPNFKAPASSIRAIELGERRMEEPKDAPVQVLVFRNGDSVSGSLLEAKKGAPVRWRLATGQEVSFQLTHIAGIHFGRTDEPKRNLGSLVELVNGDRIPGKLIACEKDQIVMEHSSFGERSIAAKSLCKLHPNPKGNVMEAGTDPLGWLGRLPRGQKGLVLSPTQQAIRVFLDGTFFIPSSERGARAQRRILRYLDDPPERFELRLEVTDSAFREPSFSMNLAGQNGSPTVQLSFNSGRIRVYTYNNTRNRGNVFVRNDRDIKIASLVSQNKTRRDIRMFIDRTGGTVDIVVDGVAAAKIGGPKTERVPGIGNQISLSAASGDGALIVSNISIGPWDGELPDSEEGVGGVMLSNGDGAAGAIGFFRDGKLDVGSGEDTIAIPIERIVSVNFGRASASVKAAGKVRLIDGTAVSVDEFQFGPEGCSARSPHLGEFQVKVADLAELVLSPAPQRFPKQIVPRKIAEKGKSEGPKE